MKRSIWGLGLGLAFGAAVLFALPRTGLSEDAKKKEFAADKGADTLDVTIFPQEMQEYYKLFSQKCSKCHTLARAINTDMTTSGWKRYVKKMMNKPDSGIAPSQGKRIYKFLKFYQQRKDEAKKAKDEKESGKKAAR